jgi:hypothetical protein
MKTGKTCATCKHAAEGYVVYCNAPQNRAISRVTGQEEYRDLSWAEHHRYGANTSFFWCRVYSLCGREGRWYEPKEETTK